MANIKKKDIKQLEIWDTKELRKLRMTIKNRISAFELTDSPKELSDTHPLANMEPGELRQLLEKVVSAERKA